MGKIITALKKEVHEAIDHVGAVKLWIQVHISILPSNLVTIRLLWAV
jgi:hypothetical protein